MNPLKEAYLQNIFRFLCNRLMPILLMGVVLWGVYLLCQSIEPLAYNALMRNSAKPAIESPAVLVLIDDESVKRLESRFGPLFWRESAYNEIFERLQAYTPAMMVFDVDVLNDSRISKKVLQNFPLLVTGWNLSRDELSPEKAPWIYSLKAGILNLEPDERDGVVRRMRRFYRVEQGVFPSLSVAMAIEYLRVSRGEKGPARSEGASRLKVQPEPRRDLMEEMWERSFPEGLLQRRDFLIRWYALEDSPSRSDTIQSHPSIPLWTLFEETGQPVPEVLKNKVVVLGTSTTAYKDYVKTPMGERHLMADIHATAMDNILFSQTLEKAPQAKQLFITLGFFLFTCLLRFRIRNFAFTVLYTVGLMGLYLGITYDEFSRNGMVLDVVTPEVFILVGLLVGSTLRSMVNDNQVRAMEFILSQLVSQSVYNEIERAGYTLKPGGIKPGGQRMEITSMFVDMRNFSTLAETMTPMAVTDMLNEFYTVVEKLVFVHGGVVDKFMGDGILIMFGGPVPQENHADAALDAARDILQATEALSQRWWEETQIWLEIGLSVNSGPAFVGFLGPIYKLEYTAIGDTVNLCVRLQGENKRFKTRIILSEYTVKRLSGMRGTTLRELERVTVRGRETSLMVYTLTDRLAVSTKQL